MRAAIVACPCITPTPDPSPQGGGERRELGTSHNSSWLSSQNGGDLVRLQVQNIIGRERVAFHSSGSKPWPSCEPSQNGWLLERPQRHHQ